MAEFVIPFKSLSYEPGQTTWGFDVARRIYHKNERVHWSGFNPALDFTDVSQSGDLVGYRERQPGHRARRAGLRRVQGQARLAARRRRRGARLHRRRQRLLQGDAGADQHAHRQSGFLRRTIGHPPGQHHAVLAVHAGNPRFLPARRVGVRIRRTQFRPQFAGPGLEQRPAVLLAQYRPRARSAGEPDRRRQIVRTIWRLRHRRVQRADRRDADGRRRPDPVGGARDAPDLCRIEIRYRLHQWRSDGTDRKLGGRRGLPIPQFEFSRRQGPASRRLLYEDLLEHEGRRRIRLRSLSTSPTSRGPAISSSSRSARTSRPRSASSTAPRSGNMSARWRI